VVSEVKGVWGTARRVPGIARLNRGNSAQFFALDCPSAGNCVAGGFYTNGAVSIRRCWSGRSTASGAPAPIAGRAALTGTSGASGIYAVSCAAAGQCGAGGYYLPHQTTWRALVVNRG